MEPKELIEKLAETNDASIMESEDAFKAACAGIGATEAEAQAAIEELGSFPIDDEALGGIAGGVPLHWSTKPFDPIMF